MVDPSAAQALIKQLNRWYRKKTKPHGTIDHYYRGTRMSFTAGYRIVTGCFSLFLLSIASVLFFFPDIFNDKSPWIILLMKIGWVVAVLAAVLAPLRAVREFTVVNDEGLIKSNLFGREQRLGWREIDSFRIKPDDNSVSFVSKTKSKLTMSLAYDGWQDFRETAVRRLSPVLYWQFASALANVDTRQAVRGSAKKLKLPRWLVVGRKR